MNRGFIGWSTPTPSAGSTRLTEFRVGRDIASPAPSITLPVPPDFRDLAISFVGKGDAGSFTTMTLQFNGDATAGDYEWLRIEVGTGGSPAAGAGGGAETSIFAGYLAGGSAVSNTASQLEFRIPEYAGTTFNKSVQVFATLHQGANVLDIDICTGYWKPATPAAITSVTLTPGSGNILTGSVVRLCATQ